MILSRTAIGAAVSIKGTWAAGSLVQRAERALPAERVGEMVAAFDVAAAGETHERGPQRGELLGEIESRIHIALCKGHSLGGDILRTRQGRVGAGFKSG